MGLIGRRCTAVMPSRPVLIGRGLVPTPYKTTHAHSVTCTYDRANQRTHNTDTHIVLFASTKQFPTNKPVPDHTVWGFDEVERVTAAIAKRETPGPIPNPEVKPFSADGTATERLWESRTPPDKHLAGATSDLVAPAPFLARYE